MKKLDFKPLYEPASPFTIILTLIPPKCVFFRKMEGDSEGGGWKLGMAFICTGIVFVLSCGVASVVYYAGSLPA